MSKPKWLDKKPNPRKFSQGREKKIARRIGARATANSGAAWSAKGDLSTSDSLIEVKSTKGSTMVIHRAWLDKIRQEAIKTQKEPVVILDFGDIQLVGVVEKHGGSVK